jgi:hypothetical protein
MAEVERMGQQDVRTATFLLRLAPSGKSVIYKVLA